MGEKSEVRFLIKTSCLLFILFFSFQALTKDIVIFPKRAGSKVPIYQDMVEMLKASLEKTKNDFGPYELKESDTPMTVKREIAKAVEGKDVNVIFHSINDELDTILSPIDIPMRKGILGYRSMFIRKSDHKKFSKIKNLNELKTFSVGQHIDWGDNKVLEFNGLKVVKARKFHHLFKMLSVGRYDYFSRGINEVYREYETELGNISNLSIMEDFLIHYPWPTLIYVSKKNLKLKKRIMVGLNRMIKDGTFNKIFEKHHKRELNIIKSKPIIKLKNPYLRKELQGLDRRYWL